MKISIALCTYNGARFLQEQLDSIGSQTRPPHELVVCDDGSTDATPEIVARYAAHAPFSVTFARNDTQLGITRNFEKAIRACTGDAIVLCDQDDVWLPDKIETLMRALESSEQVGMAFSDATLVDASLAPLPYTMWESIRFTPKLRRIVNSERALGVLVRWYVVTGATLVFRARLREHILPIPPTVFHDAWVATVCAMVSRLVAIERPLILYRQHGSNAIGGVRMGWRDRLRFVMALEPRWFDVEIERARQVRQKVLSTLGREGGGRHLVNLEQRILHLESRRALYGLPPLNKIGLVSREVLTLRYTRFSGGVRVALLDLLARTRWRNPPRD